MPSRSVSHVSLDTAARKAWLHIADRDSLTRVGRGCSAADYGRNMNGIIDERPLDKHLLAGSAKHSTALESKPPFPG